MSNYLHFSHGGKHHAHQADKGHKVKISETEVNGVSLTALQVEVGNSPKFTVTRFENWGKTQKPGLVFNVKPTTVEEVQKVIKAAGKYNLKVTFVLVHANCKIKCIHNFRRFMHDNAYYIL